MQCMVIVYPSVCVNTNTNIIMTSLFVVGRASFTSCHQCPILFVTMATYAHPMCTCCFLPPVSNFVCYHGNICTSIATCIMCTCCRCVNLGVGFLLVLFEVTLKSFSSVVLMAIYMWYNLEETKPLKLTSQPEQIALIILSLFLCKLL